MLRTTALSAAAALLVCAGFAKAPKAPVSPPAAPARAAGSLKDCRDCPEMIVVPAGTFTMGSPPGEKYRGTELQHPVTFAKPFAVSRFEITFAQWDACVAAGGCNRYRPKTKWGRGRQPVNDVSWVDATAYADWLSQKTGRRYRLLSESEWEYAARGGATTAYATGPTISTTQANFDGSERTDVSPKGVKRGRTTPVGSFKPNGFGLYDMHGNLWEWVQDCWTDEYGPATPADGSAVVTDHCGGHVLRGGSWEDYPGDIRAAARVASETEDHSWSDGIRIARELP
jgi:formylglycine-generating enzyme required for sulfatase activity